MNNIVNFDTDEFIAELIERFKENTEKAQLAWKAAKDVMNIPRSEIFSKSLCLFYGLVFENEDIAKVLNYLGYPSYLAEVKSLSYNKLLTTGCV